MSNEKMREEFEAWWAGSMNATEMDLYRFGSGYSCHETNRGWMAWQASRAAMCVELPLAFSDERATTYLTRVTNALDAAGVRYK